MGGKDDSYLPRRTEAFHFKPITIYRSLSPRTRLLFNECLQKYVTCPSSSRSGKSEMENECQCDGSMRKRQPYARVDGLKIRLRKKRLC
jgi:hypothetical protein